MCLLSGEWYMAHGSVALPAKPIEIPFAQGCFVPDLVEIGNVEENVKRLWQLQRRWWTATDKLWSEKLTSAFGELIWMWLPSKMAV